MTLRYEILNRLRNFLKIYLFLFILSLFLFVILEKVCKPNVHRNKYADCSIYFKRRNSFSWFGLKWFSYQTNSVNHVDSSLLDCFAMKFGTGCKGLRLPEEKFEENCISGENSKSF